MDREEAKEFLPIIKAFAEGKTIQFCEGNHKWRDVSLPDFQSNPKCYRIKPEPKYRPFKTQEECWNEMQKHEPFGWVKQKDLVRYLHIDCVFQSGNGELIISVMSDKSYKNTFVFEKCTFADGTPFGVKEE